MASARLSVLLLYKQLLRESQKFTLYNYREYFVRRVREEFHQNRNLKDPAKISELLKCAQENLEIIRRQVIIGNLYTPSQMSIIESRLHPSFSSRSS